MIQRNEFEIIRVWQKERRSRRASVTVNRTKMKRMRKGSKSCNAYMFWITIITAINLRRRFCWQNALSNIFEAARQLIVLNMHIIRDFSCDKLLRMHELNICVSCITCGPWIRGIDLLRNDWNMSGTMASCVYCAWILLSMAHGDKENARTLTWSHIIILNYLIASIQLKWAQHRGGNLVHPLCFPPMTASEINSNVFSLDCLFGTCNGFIVRHVRDSLSTRKPVHIAKSTDQWKPIQSEAA